MKMECNRCHQLKPEEEFNWRWKASGMRQRTCRDCQKEQKNDWYDRNRETHIANMMENKQDNIAASREYIRDYLSTHPCVDCGETDIVVLEFNHVRGEKKTEVTRLIKLGYSIEIIRAEIEKCEVLCANCHKRKTYKGSWRE